MRILIDIPDAIINEQLEDTYSGNEYKMVHIGLEYNSDKELQSARVCCKDHYEPCEYWVNGNKHMIIVR